MSGTHVSREESSMEEDIRLLKKDMWYGNGLPGMTTRMKTVEDKVEKLEKRNETNDSTLTNRMNLMIGALFTFAGAVLLHLIFKR